MAEHYTRSTLQVTAWCETCQRMTQHRVDGGRRGTCVEHEFRGVNGTGLTREQFKRKQKKERDEREPRLF